MAYKPNNSYYNEFVTSSPTTGAAVAADALPTAVMSRNNVDDGAVVVTVTAIGGGRYGVSCVIPNTYVAGDGVAVTVLATVGGVAGKAVIDAFPLDFPDLAASDVWGYVGARTLSAFGFTVNTNANATETAIKAKTDNLPADPASGATLAGLIGTPLQAGNYTAPPTSAAIATAVWGNAGRTLSGFAFTVATASDANVAAIKAKTDNLPAAPAAVGDVTAVPAAVWGYGAGRTLSAFGFTVAANNLPNDYQRNNIAVILPNAAPVWYSAPDNVGIGNAATAAAVAATNSYAAATSAAAAASDTAAIKTLTDKLNGMLELSGSVYRFSAVALSQAPAGGGGGGSSQAVLDAIAALATRVPVGAPGTPTGAARVQDVQNTVLLTGGG